MRTMVTGATVVLLLAGQSAVAQTAMPQRTGEYTVSMSSQEALGDAGAGNLAEILAPDRELSWQLCVPRGYTPAVPAGILVFISPTDRAGPPADWLDVLDERNLIWVAANGVGRGANVAEQIVAALIAPSVSGQRYEFDVNRAYLAGYSVGAYLACRVATLSPGRFRGSIFIGEAESWQPEPPEFERIRRNRHVFIVGTEDPTYADVRRVVGAYRDAGVEYARLLELRDVGYGLPEAGYIAQAIDYLDGDAVE